MLNMLSMLSSCSGLIESWIKLSDSQDLASSAGAAPVAANISPASFSEDVQSIITLSYTDAENDKATSCSISALVNVSVTQACACDGAGVCTVGVTGVSDYFGAASFSYTVNAQGGVSNSATSSLVINSVNDLPVITVPSNLLYPLDGTNEPMIQGTQYVLSYSAVDTKDNQAVTSLSCTIQSVGMDPADANYLAAGTNCNTLESLTTTNSVLIKSTAGISATTGMTANGSLTWTPTSFQRGTFQITITAGDGVGTDTNSFFVTIREPFTNGASLVLALDAAVSVASSAIAGGMAAIPRLDGTALDAVSHWLGLKGIYNGVLNAANFTSPTPWSGVGNYTNPYQLNFNGTDDVLNLGAVLSTATRAGFSMWVKPTNVNTAGAVLLSNGGGSGNGLQLRQSRTGSGQLELELGNVASNYSATVLADTPIAYWRLADVTPTVVDISGANYCGGVACNGSAGGTYTQSVVGSLAKDTNTAITMGSDGYVDFGDQFNFGNAGVDLPFSVEFWFKLSTADTGWVNWRYIFSKSDVGVAEYIVRMSDTLASLVLSSPDGVNSIIASGLHNIVPGTWNHIIVTYNGNKSFTGIKFYINGRSVNTIVSLNGAYNGMSDTASTARIGQLSVLPYDLTGGTVDELAIYNYELDAAKALNHYLAGAGCRTETPMLNNQWHHIAGIWTSTNLQLFINGAQECNYPAPGIFAPAATDLYVGATSAKTNPFAGSVADIKVQATSDGSAAATAQSMNSDTLATMNRFRSKPLEDIVKDNLILHLDAAYANMGTGPQTCGLNLADRNIQWFDLTQNAYHGMISTGGGSACGPLAWNGNGTAADPHRFILNAASPVNFELPHFSNNSLVTSYEFWIKADKQPNGAVESYDGLIGTSNAGLNLYYFTDQLGKMGWYSGGMFTSVNAANGPTDTNWHQIVFIMNGGTSLGYIYIDGTLMNPGGTAYTPAAMNVGTVGIARGNNGAYRLENPLSIVRIYQTGLTLEQIRQNCHAQKNRFAGMICAGP